MLLSPSLRPAPLAILVLASALQGGCRYRPADAWRIHAYRGRDIREFLATAPSPRAIVAGAEGEGPTYVFEYLREVPVAVPDPKPPVHEPRRGEPGVPAARPGQPSLAPGCLRPPLPRATPRSRTVLRSHLLKVVTDPAGIIRGFTCEEQPAVP